MTDEKNRQVNDNMRSMSDKAFQWRDANFVAGESHITIPPAKTVLGEITPQQNLREYYEAFAEITAESEHARTTVYAIEQTLKMLGLKIAGVNA